MVVATIVSQIKSIDFTDIKTIEAMREVELKAEITNLKEKNTELDAKKEELKKSIEEYNQSLKEKVTAPKLIDEELEKTENYLGYTNVEGEGIIVTLADTENNKITYTEILTLVNQLWIAGAEAISINDERITQNSEVVLVEQSKIFVNTRQQISPFVVKAIGNKKHLESALTIKNGYINEMQANNKNIKYTVEDKVLVPKYKSEIKLKYGN